MTVAAGATTAAAVPPFVSLRGHRGAVNALLCEDARHPQVLVSGGDDGSCRLWDVRTTRVRQCLRLRRALGLGPGDDPDAAAVGSLAYGPGDALYVAAGSAVLTFDLRRPELIVDCASRELFQDGDEEINQLAVQPTRAAKFLAAPDDHGDIRIYDLEAHRLHKTLRGQHTNLCMAAPFRPNAPWDLVSGGMDGCLLFWDFSRGRLKFRIDLNAGLDVAATGPRQRQLFNPPLVHAVAFAPNGKSLVAGVGDATVVVVDFASKQIVRRLTNHHAAVTQVHFPCFRRDEWLLSCGNDAKITVWDYPGALALDGSDAEGAHVVKDFHVQDKPNALTTSLHQNLVYVADMTNVITGYPLM